MAAAVTGSSSTVSVTVTDSGIWAVSAASSVFSVSVGSAGSSVTADSSVSAGSGVSTGSSALMAGSAVTVSSPSAHTLVGSRVAAICKASISDRMRFFISAIHPFLSVPRCTLAGAV